jgi:predicted transcriptional regulator
MKVRNNSNMLQHVDVGTEDDKGVYTYRSISISGASNWCDISFWPITGETTYRIDAGGSNLCIDDLEIWTVPREAE